MLGARCQRGLTVMRSSALQRAASFVAYGQFAQIAIVDCALLAPHGATPVAAIGFASSVLAPFFIVATALALALAPLVAREPATGALRLRECLRAQGAIVLVSLLVLGVLAGRLDVFHQPVLVARAARPHVLGMAVALPILALFATLREWSIAHERRGAPIVASLVALALKIALGACLVRVLGVVGASISTVAAYGVATLLLFVDLARRRLFTGFRLAPSGTKNETVAQGVPVVVQQLVEMGALYITSIMAGWLGTEALAAHSIALNVVNGAALVSLALAQATAVDAGRRRSSWRSATFALGAIVPIALVLLLGRRAVFADVPASSGLAIVVALALLADGVQMNLAGALRGLVDARFVAWVSVGAWGLVCLPVSYVLGFGMHLGIYGVWAALAATSVLVAMVLALRLRAVTA